MVYMLTLGYIEGKCYHIYIYIAYTWILWDISMYILYIIYIYYRHLRLMSLLVTPWRLSKQLLSGKNHLDQWSYVSFHHYIYTTKYTLIYINISNHPIYVIICAKDNNHCQGYMRDSWWRHCQWCCASSVGFLEKK